tara:strand:- start:1 stop:339 length:339 start_codon:yes stop_codon:yes gene_type:complete
MAGTTISQVIPIHRCDDYMVKSHQLNSTCKVGWFILIKRTGPTVRDITKRATPGANVSHDHKRGSAIAKAFPKIWAAGFFAYGVEVVVAQYFFKTCNFRRAGEFRSDPRRFR